MIFKNPNCISRTISNNLSKVKFYHKNIIHHFENPKNIGSFDKNNPNIGTAIIGAPTCGDVIKLQIKVNPKTMIIEDSCFKTFGCGSAIASSSYTTEYIKKSLLIMLVLLKIHK